MIVLIDMLKSKKILAVLLLAFVIISTADVIIPGRTFFPDEGRFFDEARDMAETGNFVTFVDNRAWEMPLVAMAYAPLYKFFGGGPAFIRAARVFQAFLHILTAIGAASIAFSLFKNKKTALTAMFSMIIYPSLLAYQAMLLSETIFTCLLLWGVALLYLWGADHRKMFVYVTVVLTLSVYAKAVMTALAPILTGARSFVLTNDWKKRMKYVAISCLIFIICMSPWWIRNRLVFGEFVPFTTSASWNLYLGNNPANHTAGIGDIADVDQETMRRIRSLNDEILISEAYMDEAKTYILENKMVFLRNMWLKFKRFWNFTPNYKGEIYSTAFKLYSLSLLLSWGIACPLGLASFLLNARKWRELLPIYILIVYYTFMHVVVIASLRYRLPIEPFFIIMGADCVSRIWGKFRGENLST